MPEGFDGGDESLSVSIDAAGQTFADEALVTLPAAAAPAVEPTVPANEAGLVLGSPYLIGGVAALGAALLLLALLAMGMLDVRTPATVTDRLSPYGADGRPSRSRGPRVPQTAHVGFRRHAVDLAGKSLSGGPRPSSRPGSTPRASS